MRKLTFFRLFILVWGVVLLGMLTAFTGWFHPGCLVVNPVPGNLAPPTPPGLPCLPTTPPPGTGGTPEPASASGSKQGPIRLTIFNGSEFPFSITLTGPKTYIFNVVSGATREFVVDRGTYSFDMMLCRVGAQGAMNLNKTTTLTFKACSNTKLVEVKLENKTGTVSFVTLSGAGSFVFTIPAGETRTFTIPRGEYAVTRVVCGATVAGTFEARSHRTLVLTCP